MCTSRRRTPLYLGHGRPLTPPPLPGNAPYGAQVFLVRVLVRPGPVPGRFGARGRVVRMLDTCHMAQPWTRSMCVQASRAARGGAARLGPPSCTAHTAGCPVRPLTQSLAGQCMTHAPAVVAGAHPGPVRVLSRARRTGARGCGDAGRNPCQCTLALNMSSSGAVTAVHRCPHLSSMDGGVGNHCRCAGGICAVVYAMAAVRHLTQPSCRSSHPLHCFQVPRPPTKIRYPDQGTPSPSS